MIALTAGIGCTGDPGEVATPTRTPLPQPSDKTCATVRSTDHSGQRVRGESFSGQDLTCSDFSNTRLEDVRFESLSLHRSDFKGAELRDVIFEDAQLGLATFEDSSLKNVSFKDVDLRGVTFTGSELRSIDFVDTWCPDGVHSDSAGDTCDNHGLFLDD